jgi:hypothetical protein
VLVHTLSHLMLRGLDDGQVGFAEASLAEWLVPETLTFAIYANNLKDFTLGSLWTLVTSRALGWLNDVVGRSVRCENDPSAICTLPDRVSAAPTSLSGAGNSTQTWTGRCCTTSCWPGTCSATR